MVLGMLLPKSDANQLELASNTPAVTALLAAMRNTDDLDCCSIARSLFQGLASNAGCKDLIAQAMRG
jgi:hypothetical protein